MEKRVIGFQDVQKKLKEYAQVKRPLWGVVSIEIFEDSKVYTDESGLGSRINLLDINNKKLKSFASVEEFLNYDLSEQE